MAILVVCPGCRKRFQVSDQFAGRTGPCPACKAQIKIPDKTEEVVIHGSETAEGEVRSGAGELTTKPIPFRETKLSPVVATAIAVATLAVLVIAVVVGRAGLFENSFLARAIGLILVSPPLVVAGYAFLRDSDDLDPYRGRALYMRAGICSLVYVILWWIYGPVAERLLTGEIWNWAYIAPPFIIVGSLAATFSLDLEFGNGFFHYCFYVLVTVLLRWAAGLGWVWQVAPEGLPGVG